MASRRRSRDGFAVNCNDSADPVLQFAVDFSRCRIRTIVAEIALLRDKLYLLPSLIGACCQGLHAL